VRQPIKSQVNHRRGVQRQQLAEDEAADDGDAEGAAQFRTDAGAQRERQTASNAAMVVIMMGGNAASRLHRWRRAVTSLPCAQLRARSQSS